MSNTEINLIATGVTLAVLIIGFVWQWVRESNRILEERAEKAELALKVEQTAQTVAAAVATTAKEIADKVEERVNVTAQTTAEHGAKILGAIEKNIEAIEKNIDISKAAFHEANTVNLKLEKLGLKQQDIEKIQLAAEATRGKEDKKP